MKKLRGFAFLSSLFLITIQLASAQSPGSFSSINVSGGGGITISNGGALSVTGNANISGDVTFGGSTKQLTVATTATFNGPSTFNSPFLATGILRASGAYNSGDTLPAATTNSTMLWYPRKAAFRAGVFTDGRWTEVNIGEKSVAFGSNSVASGAASTALSGSSAEGVASFAGGVGWAQGDTAFAYGRETQALGNYSFALGKGVVASTINSFVVGQYSYDLKTTPSNGATNWIPEDPLFVVGNGASSTTRSNAFVVYKDGTVIMPKPQGDIDMGIYGEVAP